MKKIYIIILSFIALTASLLCGCIKPDDSPDTFPEYTETQLFEITVGYAQNSVEKGDYLIDIRDLSVVIKDRSDLTNQIYELIKGWRNEAVSACQKLYGAIHYDGDEKEYKIVFNVTYKDNETGETFTVYSSSMLTMTMSEDI